MNALDSSEKKLKKRTMSTAVRLSLIVAMSLMGWVALPASPAAAASPSCYGQSCEGIDPAATNCTDGAYTLVSQYAVTPAGNWGNLELRYSPRCFSNWVRFTPWYGIRSYFGGMAGSWVGGSPWVQRAGGPYARRGVIGNSGAFGFGYTNWSAMISAAGTTCWGVTVYSTPPSSSGQGERESLGSYNAPCVS